MKIKIGIPQIDSTLGDFQAQSKQLIELDKHFAKEGADLVVYPPSFWTPNREEGFYFGVTFYIDAFNMLCKLTDNIQVPTVIPVPLPVGAEEDSTLLFIHNGYLDYLDEEDPDYDEHEPHWKRSSASGFSALRLEDKTIAFFQGFDDLYVALDVVTPFGKSHGGFSEKVRAKEAEKEGLERLISYLMRPYFCPKWDFVATLRPLPAEPCIPISEWETLPQILIRGLLV